ncbi:TPA: CDP-alcohol phosphatidyltransferase family protein, partial [Candidatus Bathyarchaeota archaeon]|nr:CDP-alcohol phosphatidyltransferase family protein [Candidatus Bathyarchaeota archaeon]
LSLLGLAFAALSALAYYRAGTSVERLYLAASLLLASGFFDAVDGAMARRYKEATRFGGVLDSILDRVGEIFIYLGIVIGGLASFEVGVVALSFSLMVSYVRARAEAEGLKLSGVGFAERPERLLILAIASFANNVQVGLIVIALASIFTMIQRIIYAYKKLKDINFRRGWNG